MIPPARGNDNGFPPLQTLKKVSIKVNRIHRILGECIRIPRLIQCIQSSAAPTRLGLVLSSRAIFSLCSCPQNQDRLNHFYFYFINLQSINIKVIQQKLAYCPSNGYIQGQSTPQFFKVLFLLTTNAFKVLPFPTLFQA